MKMKHTLYKYVLSQLGLKLNCKIYLIKMSPMYEELFK